MHLVLVLMSLCRKHLACDARFIVGTRIKSVTDEPDAGVRDEGEKTQNVERERKVENKENRHSAR